MIDTMMAKSANVEDVLEMFSRYILTVAQFRDVLKATQRSSNNVIATTLYSNIYDLTNGLVYLYYLHDFADEIVFNLRQELKKGGITLIYHLYLAEI